MPKKPTKKADLQIKEEKKVEPQKAPGEKKKGGDMAVFMVLLVIIIFVVLMLVTGVIK